MENVVKDTLIALGGGGLYIDDSDPFITNNTITENSILGDGSNGAQGGGIYCRWAEITNTIIYGNTAVLFPSLACPGTPDVTFCDVEGGYTGQGNFDEDPRFEIVYQPHFYRLKDKYSPCVDTGEDNHYPDPPTDFEGNSRIIDGDENGVEQVDVGWDEYVPPE